MNTLKGRDLLSIKQLAPKEIGLIIKTAEKLKKGDIKGKPLGGKSLAMIFQKPSTRTRVSFEVAMTQLGGHALFLGKDDLQLKKESIEDTGMVLSRYVDAVMARVYEQDDLEKLAGASTVPVINGLSNELHPCQILSDILTIKEHKKKLSGVKLVFMGDCSNNTMHSWLHAAPKVGVNLVACCPPKYSPDPGVLLGAEEEARKYGTSITIESDPVKAVKESDVIYTDSFMSLHISGGEEDERLEELAPYQVNTELLSHAKKDTLVMHCLPASDKEISREVLYGPQSIVFDQAENRLHTQKAILYLVV